MVATGRHALPGRPRPLTTGAARARAAGARVEALPPSAAFDWLPHPLAATASSANSTGGDNAAGVNFIFLAVELGTRTPSPYGVGRAGGADSMRLHSSRVRSYADRATIRGRELPLCPSHGCRHCADADGSCGRGREQLIGEAGHPVGARGDHEGLRGE